MMPTQHYSPAYKQTLNIRASVICKRWTLDRESCPLIYGAFRNLSDLIAGFTMHHFSDLLQKTLAIYFPLSY